MGMKRFTARRAMKGFSLIEVLIVTSITLTIASVAIPNMVTSIADMELRGGARSAAGLLQQARMQAIKSNTYLKAKYYNGTGGGFVFIDINGNGKPDATEAQVQLGNTVLAYSAPTGIAALNSTNLGFSPTTTTQIGFSAIGQPCTGTPRVCAVGMVMYFYDTRKIGSPGWAAVSVAPAGRVQTWMWNGTSWSSN